MILKLIGWIILAIIAVGVAITVIFNRGFFKESYQELRKVTWPTKEHALNSAIVTIFFIVSFSLILALIDYIINIIVIGLVR